MSSTLERRVVTLGGTPVGAGPAVVIGGRVSLRERRGDAARTLRGRARLVEPSGAGDLPWIAERADGVVVGAAWTRDIPLVRAVAGLGLPVVVERRPSASLEEWLTLAGYCAAEGDDQVILCEGGRLDLGLLRAARAASGRPVVADVRADPGLSAAAVAAGADGLIVADPAGAGPDGVPYPRSRGEAGGGHGAVRGAASGAARNAAIGAADGPAGEFEDRPEGGFEDGFEDGGRRAAEEAVTLVGALLRPETPDTLEECREAIDRVDAALATLLERRAALAGVVQTLKPVGGFAGRDPGRERALVARMARRAPELGEERLAAIMNAVIEAGLHLAEERRAHR
ncbi:chorismate mutase [Nonomuraea sp. NPDC047897]|uniref:chorismate mutase n=1 Tax=Nonomuraea sp. NPDC047897 TaxID=3364346 RepID=UPI0037129C4C